MKKEDIKYPPINMFKQAYNEIMVSEIYEKYFEVQNGDVVIDIGANIGLFPLSVSEKFSKCYAIEPDPENFTFLKENLGDSIDRVIFINEGISNKNILSPMTIDGGTGRIIGEGLEVTEDLVSIRIRVFRNFMVNF